MTFRRSWWLCPKTGTRPFVAVQGSAAAVAESSPAVVEWQSNRTEAEAVRACVRLVRVRGLR